MSNRSYIEWVDCAKGMAILLIIHLHVLNGLSALYPGLENSNEYIDYVARLIRRFHMPLFFFLSGLFVARSLASRSVREYVLDKVYVILWPYVLWSVVQGLIQVYFSGYTNNIWTIQHLVYALVFDPIQQFWFVYVLFIFYMLYLVLRKSVLLALSLSVALYVASYYVADVYYIRIFRHLLFFVLGYVCVDHVSSVVENRYVRYSIVPILIMLCADVYYNISNDFLSRLIVIIAVVIMFITLANVLVKYNVKIFNYIGSIVLQIYLTHMLATAGMRILLHNLLGVTDVTVHIVAGTVAGLVFPVILVLLVNRFRIPYLFSLKRV